MAVNFIAVIAGACLGISTVMGTVVDAGGAPVPNARVFAEAGLAAPLQEATAGPDGRFRLEELGVGDTGIFAYAPGHAFGGLTLSIAVEDNPPPVTIRLGEEGSISGKVIGGKDTPVQGALVTRVALLGAEKVGIPLSKLKEAGIEVPTSGADGRFTIPHLPKGGTVALKFTHAQFALEGLPSVPVGEDNLKVQLYLGVLVEGDVVKRGDGAPIANAPVLLRNAQPPYDTTLASSDARGKFSVRLKPGVYLYQAAGGTIQSSGWTKLLLNGEEPTVKVRVIAGGTGTVRGEVKDAKTGQPIAGARVSLTTNGNRAAVERTGPTGIFQFNAGVGENIVRLEVAQGFQPPAGGNAVKLSVKEGETVVLPGMWLAPLPSYRLQVVDEQMNPAASAVVRLLQPNQFGLRTSGADGWLDLNIGSLPEGGRIIGLVESADGALGGLFALTTKDAAGAKVQLLPTGHVEGRVLNGRGKPVPGAVVGGAFPGTEKDAEPVLLWKTVTDAEGHYAWEGVCAGVPQLVIARQGSSKLVQGAPFNLAPRESKSLDDLKIESAGRAESGVVATIAFDKFDSACGPDLGSAPKTVALFGSAEEAVPMAESLQALAQAHPEIAVCVVAESAPDCAGVTVPIRIGKAPGVARTYVLDAAGKILLQTFGLPPMSSLR